MNQHDMADDMAQIHRANRVPRVVPTRRSLWQRFSRWMLVRRLTSEIAAMTQTEQALVRGIEEDELQLRRIHRQGMKNLLLSSRREHELHELDALRKSIQRARLQLQHAENS